MENVGHGDADPGANEWFRMIEKDGDGRGTRRIRNTEKHGKFIRSTHPNEAQTVDAASPPQIRPPISPYTTFTQKALGKYSLQDDTPYNPTTEKDNTDELDLVPRSLLFPI